MTEVSDEQGRSKKWNALFSFRHPFGKDAFAAGRQGDSPELEKRGKFEDE